MKELKIDLKEVCGDENNNCSICCVTQLCTTYNLETDEIEDEFAVPATGPFHKKENRYGRCIKYVEGAHVHPSYDFHEYQKAYSEEMMCMVPVDTLSDVKKEDNH